MASAQRVQRALANFRTQIITLDLKELGNEIHKLIVDVGQLNLVTVADLNVFASADGEKPKDVNEAMRYGTKFFDAVYYFSLEESVRPATQAGTDIDVGLPAVLLESKKRLLWTAIFLMLRGSYPESTGVSLGSEVPAFLKNMCGMNESPAAVAAGLASFPLKNIGTNWIKSIKWSEMAPAIRQRLGLGLAGYRMMGPFALYPCKDGASQDAREAYNWVRKITTLPKDYAILSATRSADLIAKYGSWNHCLGDLILECFTKDDIDEMIDSKIIFEKPRSDPRYKAWRAWPAGGDLQLTDPIGL